MKIREKDNRLTVCYFGTYRSGYPRNQLLIRGLQANEVTVYECHETLWYGIDDRVDIASGGWLSPRFWGRLFVAYLRLFLKHRLVPDYDVMMLGYPGQFDTFLGRILSWWRRKPMVLDLYMSLYLIALERGLVERSPFSGRLLRWLEKCSLRLPNLIIADTGAYRDFHCETYGIGKDRFQLVPAGADERYFYPRPEVEPPLDGFRVIYYGTFIPNHGLDTIINAANLLKLEAAIQFDLYGDGPELNRIKLLAEKLGLASITFHGWIVKAQLPLEISRSHVSLGVFGKTPQSMQTIQNKIWESLAMGRPVITGESPTMDERFESGKHLLLVTREDPMALAEAIRELERNPQLRDELGRAGLQTAQRNNSEAIGKTLVDVLSALVT